MLKRMNKEQRNELIMLIIGGVLWIGAFFIPEGVWRVCAYLAIFLFIAAEVLIGVVHEFKGGEIFSEEFLMTLASVGALILGEYPEAVAVMLLYRVGEWFADLAVDSSKDSLAALAELRPDKARVLRSGEELPVNPSEVSVGEICVVLPGERIALDGEIIEGTTTIDASSLTGESLPLEKQAGDELFSGCVNISGRVEMKVISAQGDNAVDRILKMTSEAKERKAKVEDFIHRFAKIYTPAVIAAAAVLALVPSIISGNWSEWVHKALVFLTVSCPCALVVSVPLSFFCGIGCASRHGILIKGSVHLEALAQAKICAFDKTGTLTTGGFRVSEIKTHNYSKEEFVTLTAAAESFSSHPVAKCIAALSKTDLHKNLIYEKPGMGVCAVVSNHRVLVGNEKLLSSEGISIIDSDASVHVAIDGQYAGYINIADDVKSSSAEAIKRLKELGIKKTVLLSGDNEASVMSVAKAVGIDEAHSALLPQDKVEHMESLMREGNTVYTGDGINDAPVLAAAGAGVAMGGLGSDAAIETADVVIMDDNLVRLPLAMRIARKTKRIATQNIIASLAVKFAILGISIFIRLPMYVAIVGDVGVLLLATLNALRAWKIDE